MLQTKLLAEDKEYKPYIEDTIAQIATPRGQGGIGIVRISGSNSLAIAHKLFRPYGKNTLDSIRPYQTMYGYVVSNKDNKNIQEIDECLLLYMKAPHSYTAEDVVELQCHGGTKVLNEVLSLVFSLGARPAEAGEFTKRAFLNGRLDLTRAEAVMDLINAKTETSLKIAKERLSGALETKIKNLRDKLLATIAHIEAAIDFPEDDIEEVEHSELKGTITSVLQDIEGLIRKASTGRIFRDGIKTVIVGRPNAGKSSLMNALLRFDRAIVSASAGTTRDTIEEMLDIRGVPIRLIDTAGIRNTLDTVEEIGVSRAKSHIKDAELILAVFDLSEDMTPEDKEIIDSLKAHDNLIVILNKNDLEKRLEMKAITELFRKNIPIVTLSAKNSEGLKDLEQAMLNFVYNGESEESIIEGGVPSSEREKEILLRAKSCLVEAINTADRGLGLDFISIDIRAGYEVLGEIIGESLGENIIDEIFSRFCLGK